MHLSVHAHITHTHACIRARMCMHMHMTHSSAHAQTRMHPGTCGPTTHAHPHPRMNTHVCIRTHTRYARTQAHACMHHHNAYTCIHTYTCEHTCTCARTRANTRPHILAARSQIGAILFSCELCLGKPHLSFAVGCCQLGRGEEGNSSNRAELGAACLALEVAKRKQDRNPRILLSDSACFLSSSQK